MDQSIYFVMTDRFANGDASNDRGGIDGGPLDHGFHPDDFGWYQGGDLVGLTERLGYLAGMGIDAIWLTPPFANRPVQGLGSIENSSAGYHGYWQVDWTRIDPHLGTEEDMQRLLDTAGDVGIDVFFDMVVNHTGDVITYAEGTFAYRSKNVAPYLDAAGNPFDDRDFVGGPTFPDLDPTVSFPYTPTFATPADATIKSPAWLNDPIYYHNRGNSTFVDESSLYGDFFGLDDLFTEHPDVVDGLTALASDIVDRYDIAGFRVDTVKHVNDEFWQQWVPAVLTAAKGAGREDFFVFGEVYSSDPIFNSHYTTNLGFPSLLDFVVNDGLEQYVARDRPADALVQAFDQDDWFTDADSNASMLVKFFGNHDIGRMGRLISAGTPGGRPEVLTEKMLLGFDLLFLTRGIPVVYYGDEQGFVGDGGDRAARQTMFPATAVQYVQQPTIGSEATVGDDNFDPSHPFYLRVSQLNRLRDEHPALVTGAQIVGEPQGPVFSFSRVDREEKVEYLVVANNGPLAIPAEVTALSGETEFVVIHGGEGTVTSTADGTVTVEVPARSAVVLMATAPLPVPPEPPSVRIVRPDSGAAIPTVRYRIEAEVGDRRYAEVTFSMSVEGAEPVVLGVDDAPPYRLYWNNHSLPAGTEVELTVVVSDGSGRYASDSRTVTIGPR
ncbi:MAG: alpha-amylase family glycosyl hydrolase [Acidimicrobiia bacterium]